MAEESSIDEDRYELDPSVVRAILDASEAGAADQLAELMAPLHAADIADMLEQVEPEERTAILRLFEPGIDGEILSEIDDSIREEVIDTLSPEVLGEAVRELESDDVVDIIEDLDVDQQDLILEALEDSDRVAVEAAMSYPEFSAGRLMQREIVAGPEHWTVGDAIDYLRARDDLPEDFYHMILVDPAFRPTGYVTLGKLLGHPREEALFSIREESFRTIEVTEDEGEVAYAFNQYHLISAPVVDHNGRLVGVITIDDAMIVLERRQRKTFCVLRVSVMNPRLPTG